jgi:tripartite-type tricarboxylate transporter receptor subunit TctC
VTGGAGSAQHLASAMFESMAGIRMTHVPHKGITQAAQDTSTRSGPDSSHPRVGRAS